MKRTNCILVSTALITQHPTKTRHSLQKIRKFWKENKWKTTSRHSYYCSPLNPHDLTWHGIEICLKRYTRKNWEETKVKKAERGIRWSKRKKYSIRKAITRAGRKSVRKRISVSKCFPFILVFILPGFVLQVSPISSFLCSIRKKGTLFKITYSKWSLVCLNSLLHGKYVKALEEICFYGMDPTSPQSGNFFPLK
jgi:hypothetical protein